jgi:DNA-binding transcriptional regulator YiaG
MKKPRDGIKIPIAPQTLREVRTGLNETQGEFATRLGINQATVSRWEAGALPQRGLAQQLLLRVLQDIERVYPIR